MLSLDIVASVGGFLIPPVFDFIKKKFIPDSDTPESTLSTLATTKPDIMPGYVQAQAVLLDAQTRYFNRDMAGEASRWVINLRGSIRPVGTIYSGLVLGLDKLLKLNLTPGSEATFCLILSSWFGCRILGK